MDMHTEDLQPPGEPLHVVDQLGVARVGADLLRRPVGEGMRAGAHQPQAAGGGGRPDLVDGRLQVGLRLGDGRADARDHLDARLEQLVLRLGVLAAVRRAQLGKDVARRALELTRVHVDELELPLDAEARAGRGRERDLHEWKVPVRHVLLVGRRTYPRSGFYSRAAQAAPPRREVSPSSEGSSVAMTGEVTPRRDHSVVMRLARWKRSTSSNRRLRPRPTSRTPAASPTSATITMTASTRGPWELR